MAILKAVFSGTWRSIRLDGDAIGDHMELAYSRIGRVIALYVVAIVSFCFPHLVDVKAFRILSVLFALSFALVMCVL